MPKHWPRRWKLNVMSLPDEEARAELLARTGAHAEARHAYEIAIGLERDPAVRRFLQRRQAGLVS